MVSECILSGAYCFEIRQCNTDMKDDSNSVNALSTAKLLSDIRSKMFQIFL